jgi:hypothetical protein
MMVGLGGRLWYTVVKQKVRLVPQMGERAMSSLDKMWASFVALGFMAVASLLITYARTRTKGAVRLVLSVIAFIMLILMLPFALLSML